MKTFLRWLAILPGVALTIVLTLFLTNLVAHGRGVDPMVSFDSEGSHGLSFYIMKFLGQPLLVAGMAVVAARSIAPSDKNLVGGIFATLVCCTIFSLGCAAWGATKGDVPVSIWVQLSVAFVGGIVGAFTPLEK